MRAFGGQGHHRTGNVDRHLQLQEQDHKKRHCKRRRKAECSSNKAHLIQGAANAVALQDFPQVLVLFDNRNWLAEGERIVIIGKKRLRRSERVHVKLHIIAVVVTPRRRGRNIETTRKRRFAQTRRIQTRAGDSCEKEGGNDLIVSFCFGGKSVVEVEVEVEVPHPIHGTRSLQS